MKKNYKKNEIIYKEYLNNIFNKGPKKRVSDKYDISIQTLQYIISKKQIDIEKLAKINREKLLVQHKYKYIKPNTNEERFALVQSLIWEGFTYRTISEVTNISISKINRLVKEYSDGEFSQKGKKNTRKINKITMNLFKS